MLSKVTVDVSFPIPRRLIVFSQSCWEVSASLSDVGGVAVEAIIRTGLRTFDWPQLDSDEDFRSGFRTFSHHCPQQSFSGPYSPGDQTTPLKITTLLSIKLPRPKTDMVKKSCSYKSITRWNALENQMRSIQDVDAFKKSLKCIFKPRML